MLSIRNSSILIYIYMYSTILLNIIEYNKELHIWLDNALNKFDEIYSGDRPGFLDGYKKLKDEITPWGD